MYIKRFLTVDDFKSMMEHALKIIGERVDEFSRLNVLIPAVKVMQAAADAVLNGATVTIEDFLKKCERQGGCEDPRVAVTEDGLFVMAVTS